MTIDVYADIACPWCYVGRARMKRALDQCPNLDVTLCWRPFQLQPGLSPDGRDFQTVLEEKFGSWSRAQQMFDRICCARLQLPNFSPSTVWKSRPSGGRPGWSWKGRQQRVTSRLGR